MGLYKLTRVSVREKRVWFVLIFNYLQDLQ